MRLRPVGIAHSFGGCTLSRCTVTVSDSLQRVEWFGLFKLFTIHSVIEDPRLFECVTNSLVFAGLGVPIIQQFHKAALPTFAKFHVPIRTNCLLSVLAVCVSFSRYSTRVGFSRYSIVHATPACLGRVYVGGTGSNRVHTWVRVQRTCARLVRGALFRARFALCGFLCRLACLACRLACGFLCGLCNCEGGFWVVCHLVRHCTCDC